jgi:hypothetical protein
MRIIKHRPRPDVRVAQPPSGRVPPLPSGWRDHSSERGGIKVGLVNSADFLLVGQYYDGYSRSARMPAIQR